MFYQSQFVDLVINTGPKVDSDREAYRVAEKATEAGPGAAPVAGYRGGYGRGAAPL